MKKLYTIIIVVLLAATAWSQSPEKMSYQAVIRNSSDALVTNTTVGMQISILQGSASGSVVYTETQTPATNANGLISIEIGGGFGFSTIDWASGPYFIKTETDPTGGMNYSITGTSQLTSVPYALYAANSGSSVPGPQGPAGMDGIDGMDGTNGMDGVQGPQGPKGDKGDKGEQGIQGAKGDKGDKGDTGTQGIQGMKGDKGDKGDTGARGVQGMKGDKGDKGDTGEQGIQGIQGDKGDTGTQGIQGIKGDKGDKGDTGEQGIQGIQGDKGDTGTQGIQGMKGEQGDKGDTGEQGIQGIQGDKGDTGTQGIQGMKGEKGDKGDTGEQGIQGVKGDKGDKGDPQDISSLATKTALGDSTAQVRSEIPDVSGFLTSETDPGFSTSQAANITAGDITNLGNLSGTNTGDQDLSNLATKAYVDQLKAKVNRMEVPLVVAGVLTVSVGDSFGGGIVAYIFKSSDPGYVAGETHGLIAAPGDQSTNKPWYNGSYITTGATATALGTGKTNTNNIVSSQGAGSYAAQLCADLDWGGYNDWYLPSKDELNKLYINRVAIGGFASDYYWSSSEFNNNWAWVQYFPSGGWSIYDKGLNYRVRAVRTF